MSRELLNAWYQRVTVTQRAHYLSADHFKRRSYQLGIPAIVLSTIVGTSIFATLQQEPGDYQLPVRITIGLASVLAAVLTALQTFLGYSERAEKHRLAGARYGALGRELEELLASPEAARSEAVGDVRKRLDALALESPNNPVWIYRNAGGSRKELGDRATFTAPTPNESLQPPGAATTPVESTAPRPRPRS